MALRRLWSRYPYLAACAAVGLVAALIVLVHRYQLEQSYRTVEITLDGDDWMTLARRTGVGQDRLYDAVRQAGARSMTLYASSLKRLQDAGRLTYMTGADLMNAARTGPVPGAVRDLLRTGRVRAGDTYVVGPPPILAQVQSGLAAQLPPHAGAPRLTALTLDGGGTVLDIQGRGPEIEDASLGLPPEDVAAVRAHRLAVEARLRNVHELSPDGLQTFFAGLRTLGERFTLIFDGTQVLGYELFIPDVAEQMRAAGYAFGEIESFTARRRQRGDAALAAKMVPNVLRVFSLTPDELAQLAPDEARDKYVLAARERNVRVLYVRPFLTTSAGVDEIQTNVDYVRAIRDDLEGAGYRMGKATPLPNVTVPPAWFLLMALGALAATAMALAETAAMLARPLSMRALSTAVAVGVAVTAAVIAVHHVTLWSQLLALLAAMAFPTLALMGLLSPEARTVPAAIGWSRLAGRSIARLWGLSAISVLGGILVAALLSQWMFMLEIRGFLGVKPAHVIPVVLIGLMLAAADAPRGQLWPRLRAWARQPLLLEYGIAIIVIGLAAVFALGRTGNAGLPALGALELKSRTFLQHLVVARPRTKEYLVGHPFMVLTFALSALGLRRWVLPAAVIGAVGQVGLVNSFSHIHTPLVYVLLRTVYALIFGSIIGAVLVALLLWSRRRWFSERRVPPALEPERLLRAGAPPMR